MRGARCPSRLLVGLAGTGAARDRFFHISSALLEAPPHSGRSGELSIPIGIRRSGQHEPGRRVHPARPHHPTAGVHAALQDERPALAPHAALVLAELALRGDRPHLPARRTRPARQRPHPQLRPGRRAHRRAHHRPRPCARRERPRRAEHAPGVLAGQRGRPLPAQERHLPRPDRPQFRRLRPDDHRRSGLLRLPHHQAGRLSLPQLRELVAARPHPLLAVRLRLRPAPDHADVF